MASKVGYRIVQYSEGQLNESKGVKAGMWAVVQTCERDFAFADTQGQAIEIKRELVEAAKARGVVVIDQ